MAKIKERCVKLKCAKRVRTAAGKKKCVKRLPKSKQPEVCFKHDKLSSAKRKRKIARARKALLAFACKAPGHPVKACKDLKKSMK